MSLNIKNIVNGQYKYGFKNPEKFSFKTEKGLNEKIIKQISNIKKEPEWMLNLRLKAYKYFVDKDLPAWGADLKNLDFNEIYYYGKPEGEQANSWDDVPEDIKDTFNRLGIPEAEKKFLAGVGAQYECLSGETKIFTNPKGAIKIKDAKQGDCIFAFDEKEN